MARNKSWSGNERRAQNSWRAINSIASLKQACWRCSLLSLRGLCTEYFPFLIVRCGYAAYSCSAVGIAAVLPPQPHPNTFEAASSEASCILIGT
jgi:hypothetical protein